MISRRLGSWATSWWVVTLILAVWWLATKDGTSPFWPPLREILSTIHEDWVFDHFRSDLLPTLGRVVAGLTVSVVAGVVLGIYLGTSERLRRALEPLLEFLRAIPAAALIPISMLILGLSNVQKVVVIVLVSVWPVLLNTVDGVRGVDSLYYQVSSVFHLRRWDRIRLVTLPSALPQIFAGIRLALASALLVIVIAELFASSNGVGHYLLIAKSSFQIQEMWAGTVVLALTAFVLNAGFLLVERHVLGWHRAWKASNLGEHAGVTEPASAGHDPLSTSPRYRHYVVIGED